MANEEDLLLSLVSVMESTESFIKDFQPDHPQFRRLVCRHWKRGRCARGDHCNFLHVDQKDLPFVKIGRSPNSPTSEELKLEASISSDYVLVPEFSPTHNNRAHWKDVKSGSESD